MLSPRRSIATIFVLVPLVYVSWWKFVASDATAQLPQRATEDTLNNTLGFSKVFVINLPSRIDRRDAMALAGAVSDIDFTWIDGLTGDQVPGRTMPVGGRENGMHSSGARGSWRSHMNALQAIVQQDLESALILEDDVDWDVRLKQQLQTLASASRTWLGESESGRNRDDESYSERTAEEYTIPLSTTSYVHSRSGSVYGDDWDVLWLGHCGADLPDGQSSISPLRIAISKDETVPAVKHLKPHPFALRDKLGETYPPHTRVVHAASGNICSLAYAVSQQGARKMLWQFGENFSYQWDLMLRDWCQGEYTIEDDRGVEWDGKGAKGKSSQTKTPICLTVQPPLISHHYASGGASDIQSQGGGYARGTGTPYIRLSVRKNLERLVTGSNRNDLVDQLPDDGKTIW